MEAAAGRTPRHMLILARNFPRYYYFSSDSSLIQYKKKRLGRPTFMKGASDEQEKKTPRTTTGPPSPVHVMSSQVAPFGGKAGGIAIADFPESVQETLKVFDADGSGRIQPGELALAGKMFEGEFPHQPTTASSSEK